MSLLHLLVNFSLRMLEYYARRKVYLAISAFLGHVDAEVTIEAGRKKCNWSTLLIESYFLGS